MNELDYKVNIKGYSLLSACIVNENFYAFMAQEIPETGIGVSDDNYDYPTRLISIKERIVKHTSWQSGLKYPKIIHTGDNGYLVTSWEGRSKETRDIPKTFPQYTLDTQNFRGELQQTISINQLKKIDGDIYAVGTHRKLLKRTGNKDWVDLSNETNHPNLFSQLRQVRKTKKGSISSTFHSVDGFNKNNIFTAGWQGDCWHFNGAKWHLLDPPTNEDFHRVICGDNGLIYFITTWGSILSLQYDTNTKTEKWNNIPQEVASKDHGFEDATWFKGKLYLSNTWGLFVMENQKITRVDFTGQGKNAQTSFKNVTSGHGVLISYGLFNAVVFDGKSWTSIISPYDEKADN